MVELKMIFAFMLLLGLCCARNPFPDHTDDNFQNECLSATNRHRATHHAQALHVDKGAVDYAKSRCNLISQYEGLSHGHAGLQGYGENLYWGGNSANVLGGCGAAIESWYNEGKQYNYNNPGFSGSTGHFTQLVWKSSTGVGCARCGGKGAQWYETYVVCNYKPAGNYLNQFKQNVSPP